jgi:hypothetical protein
VATEFTLRRADGQPFGSFELVQALIRRVFPSVEFFWTTSGAEKIEMARHNGVEMPPQILEAIKDLPSLLEGVAQGEGYHVSFGLGHEEPVTFLCIEPRGSGPELDAGLESLEAEAGLALRVSGTE